MPHRSTMPNRPWLDGATYDKYDTTGAVHFDLYAYSSADGYVYFDIQCTERGKKPLARTVWRYVPEFDAWSELPDLPLGLIPLRWRRETHATFKRAHGRLLAQCVTPPGYTNRSVQAHYVKPYDADPWPRNTLNTFRPYEYREGKRPGRPRTRKAFDGSLMEPVATRVTSETQQTIDILMGVDVLDIL